MNRLTLLRCTRVGFAGMLAGGALLAAGCGLEQPYPAKSFYTIEVAPPTAPPSARSGVLRVARVRVAEPFDERTFHYRRGPQRFEPDYYTNFITDPGHIIAGDLVAFLTASGPYETVVDASSPVGATRTLVGNVSALYGDYTDPAAPQAVVEASFFLLDESSAEATVLLRKEYRESLPLEGDGSAPLVSGWGRALGSMFGDLARDLEVAKTP